MTEKQLLDALEDACRNFLTIETPGAVQDALHDLDAFRRLKDAKRRREKEFKARQIDAFQTSEDTKA